jgi:type IX secretion system PorP/SprF family membrane protein
MKTVLLSCFLAFLLSFSICAQQSQLYNQYLFNRFVLNPAACGANVSSIGLVAKSQWTGFDDAPFNTVLSGQFRLSRRSISDGKSNTMGFGRLDREKVALGFVLSNDIYGPLRNTSAQFTYAYHLEDGVGQWSFGLTGSFSQFHLNREKMTTELGYDRLIDGAKLNSLVFDASFGTHYTNRDFYLGASAFNLLQSFLSFNSNGIRIMREYLLLGGWVFDLNHEWSLVPGAHFKFTERGAGQLDLSLLCYYYDILWGGLSFRSGGSFSGSASLMFGFRYQKFCFGYAFDYALSDIRKYSFGSHELMVSMTMGASKRFFRYTRGRYELHDVKRQYRIK